MMKALIALLLILSASSNAALLREITFEGETAGDCIDNVAYLNSSGNCPVVAAAENGVTPRSGTRMMKTYLNRLTSDTDYRTEARLDMYFDKGTEYWVGVSIYLPTPWDKTYGDSYYNNGIIFQLHDTAFDDPGNTADSPWRIMLPYVFDHRAEGLRSRNSYSSSANGGASDGNLVRFSDDTLWSGAIEGAWVDIVMHVKWSGATSKNDTDGFITVWVNGTIVTQVTGQNYMGELVDGPYIKFGLYAAGWKTEKDLGVDSRTLYHDELRVGDANSSYEEVSPGGAPPPESNAPPSAPTLMTFTE